MTSSPSHRSAQGGFTLVEILVVMAMLGILSALAVPQLLEARSRSRAAACDSLIGQLEAEIANEIDLVLGDTEAPSCGDMGTTYGDLSIIRCVAERHGDAVNPRNAAQPAFINYAEAPIPYDSCQVGLDEDLGAGPLAVKLRQYAAPGAAERSFTISLE